MQTTNVKRCPHVTSWHNRNETSSGVVFLCDECQAVMETMIADKLHGMMGSILTPHEWAKIMTERWNMRIEQELRDTVAAAHVVAGYPQHLMLPAPVRL